MEELSLITLILGSFTFLAVFGSLGGRGDAFEFFLWKMTNSTNQLLDFIAH